MNPIHPKLARRRGGYTLIELLVVIAIIASLAGLLLGGVMYLLRRAPEVVMRNDISQLNVGMQRFKAKYGFYPPNFIRLRANMQEYTASPADQHSVRWIGRMWPNLPGKATNIPWAGATGMASGTYLDLDSDQCLVFFLGGPPVGGGAPGLLGGFSNNPLDPAGPTTNPRERYFDFDAGRLINRGGSPFLSFVDPFDKQQPYIYFGSQNASMGSNGYDSGPNGLGVKPYMSKASPKAFHMPDSFQIICAGPDGQFGPGGLWTSIAASSTPPAGQDDYSNFHDKKMGIP